MANNVYINIEEYNNISDITNFFIPMKGIKILDMMNNINKNYRKSIIVLDLRKNDDFIKSHLLYSINVDLSKTFEINKIKHLEEESQFYTFIIIDRTGIINSNDIRNNNIASLLNIKNIYDFIPRNKNKKRFRPIIYCIEGYSILEDICSNINTYSYLLIKKSKIDHILIKQANFNPIKLKDNIWIGDNLILYLDDYKFKFNKNKIGYSAAININISNNNNNNNNNNDIISSIEKFKENIDEQSILLKSTKNPIIYLTVSSDITEYSKNMITFVAIAYKMISEKNSLSESFCNIYLQNINYPLSCNMIKKLFHIEHYNNKIDNVMGIDLYNLNGNLFLCSLNTILWTYISQTYHIHTNKELYNILKKYGNPRNPRTIDSESTANSDDNTNECLLM